MKVPPHVRGLRPFLLILMVLYAGFPAVAQQFSFSFTAPDSADYNPVSGRGCVTVGLAIDEASGSGFPHAVQGFSCGVVYGDELNATSANAEGAVLALDNGPFGPAFWGLNLDAQNAVGDKAVTLGVVFDTDETGGLDTLTFADPTRVATLGFETTGGSWMSDFDGRETQMAFASAGTPIVDNGVVIGNGQEFQPSLGSTTISLAVSRPFRLSLLPAVQTVTYSTLTGAADFSVDLAIEEAVSASECFVERDVQGFSVAFSYDGELVTPSSMDTRGSVAALAKGPLGPAFWGVDLAASGADGSTGITIGCVFDFEALVNLSFPARETVGEAIFSTNPAVFTDNKAGASMDLVFRPLGTPVTTVNSVVTVGNEEHFVLVTNASVDFSPSIDAPGFTFAVHAPGAPVSYDVVTGAGAFSVDLSIEENPDHGGFPSDTQGFSMALGHDDALVTPTAGTALGALAALRGGLGPEFFAVDLAPAGSVAGITAGVVYGIEPPLSLAFPAEIAVIGVDYETVAATFMGDDDGATTVLDWQEAIGLGAARVSNLIVVGGTDRRVSLENATVTFAAGAIPFIRGDCNDQSGINIADGIFLLRYLFLEGRVPPCFAACDMNGNGDATLVDALANFNFQFLGGAPPVAPYPNCGFSNEPGLSCEEFNTCE